MAVCFDAGLLVLATSNLFLTTLFCSSVLLYIEPCIIKELNLSLWSAAKCLAMRAPNEKPTKWILLKFNSLINWTNCSEKYSKLTLEEIEPSINVPDNESNASSESSQITTVATNVTQVPVARPQREVIILLSSSSSSGDDAGTGPSVQIDESIEAVRIPQVHANVSGKQLAIARIQREVIDLAISSSSEEVLENNSSEDVVEAESSSHSDDGHDDSMGESEDEPVTTQMYAIYEEAREALRENRDQEAITDSPRRSSTLEEVFGDSDTPSDDPDSDLSWQP